MYQQTPVLFVSGKPSILNSLDHNAVYTGGGANWHLKIDASSLAVSYWVPAFVCIPLRAAKWNNYNDVIMSPIASQITSLAIVYSTVYSDADQRKHQSFASLAVVRGIHRGQVNSPHKGPVTWKNAAIWWRHHVKFSWLAIIANADPIVSTDGSALRAMTFIMTSSSGNNFHVTGLLCGEFTGHRWIPRIEASDAELWCFLWSVPEPTFAQTKETRVIWDAIALIMTLLNFLSAA